MLVHPCTRILVAAALVTSLGSAAHARAVRFQPAVSKPATGNVLSLHGINNAGQIAGAAGSSQVNPGFHATIWNAAGFAVIDETFNISEAMVINDAGATAGVGHFCPPQNGPCTGFIARSLPGGTFDLVGTLGGHNGEVLDINSSGDFVGWWYTQDSLSRAFLFTEKSGVLNLGTLGGFASTAHAVNDSLQIVGESYNASLKLRAFLWENDAMVDLGTLGGASSGALDINNDSVIVGWASVPAIGDGFEPMHAFRHTAKDGMQDIHTLERAIQSRALTVNSSGMIAGYWHALDGIEHLFIYTPETGMTDLGQPDIANFGGFFGPIHLNEDGWMTGMFVTNMYQTVSWVRAPGQPVQLLADVVVNSENVVVGFSAGINDAGQIAAFGNDINTGQPVVLLLEPVPPADINADGSVNIADLLAVIAAWGACSNACFADVNTDGQVNIADLLLVISNWS